jgi:hypothetical protein
VRCVVCRRVLAVRASAACVRLGGLARRRVCEAGSTQHSTVPVRKAGGLLLAVLQERLMLLLDDACSSTWYSYVCVCVCVRACVRACVCDDEDEFVQWSMSMSLDHSVHFHRPELLRADEWMLVQMESAVSFGARGVYVCVRACVLARACRALFCAVVRRLRCDLDGARVCVPAQSLSACARAGRGLRLIDWWCALAALPAPALHCTAPRNQYCDIGNYSDKQQVWRTPQYSATTTSRCWRLFSRKLSCGAHAPSLPSYERHEDTVRHRT